jgi:hypothetical protein
MSNYNADTINYHGTTAAATLATLRNKMIGYSETDDILVIKKSAGAAHYMAGGKLFVGIDGATPVVRAQAAGNARIEYASDKYLDVKVGSAGNASLVPTNGLVSINTATAYADACTTIKHDSLPQLGLRNGSAYVRFGLDASGKLTITPSGGDTQVIHLIVGGAISGIGITSVAAGGATEGGAVACATTGVARVQLSPTAPAQWYSLATTGGVDGQIIVVMNISGTAANTAIIANISGGTDAEKTIDQYRALAFIYVASITRWIPLKRNC